MTYLLDERFLNLPGILNSNIFLVTRLKYKDRFCVRVDLQTERVDYFETYAPVDQWSTIRLLLTLILSNGWATKQVDYTNVFAQAEIMEEVYVEPLKAFGSKDKLDKILLPLKSLYGLKQAPKLSLTN